MALARITGLFVIFKYSCDFWWITNQGASQKNFGVPLQELAKNSVMAAMEKEKGKQNAPARDNLVTAMQRASRLLFNDPKDAEMYLKTNNFETFRFYVYDNLAPEQRWQYVEACLSATRGPDDKCGWIDLCGETGTSSSRYGKKRYNRNGDVLLAKTFSQYNGALRTRDPSEASLFIVPFPSQGSFHCMGSNQTSMDSFVNGLTYLNKHTMRRHMFLSSALRPAANLYMNRFPFQVTIGPAQHFMCKFGRRCGNIIMPYLNTNEEYQPDSLSFRYPKERHYSVVAYFNRVISGNGKSRKAFMDAAANVSKLAGKPVLISGLGPLRSMPNEKDVMASYRDSIFCPCLRGDSPPQKRFFDSILSGCIPVVLTYPAKGDRHHVSHFAKDTESTRVTYPYSRDIFFKTPSMGLRYEDFIVEVDGECGPSCILPTLEKLLTRNMTEVEKKFQTLQRVASLFSYGMRKDNALVYGDAVSAILVQARHYIEAS